jgi:cytochrome P450
MAGVLTLEGVDLLDHDLFAEREPWDVFELLQREAPVFWHPEPPPGRGFWAVTKYGDVLAVLKDWQTFSSQLGGAALIEDLPEDVLAARRNFMETDPPRHTQFRRIFAADFTPKAVHRYEPWLHELVGEVLDHAVALE